MEPHLDLPSHSVPPLLSDGGVDQEQPKTKNTHSSEWLKQGSGAFFSRTASDLLFQFVLE